MRGHLVVCLLVCLQARQNLKVLLLWLIDVMQHIASGAGPATTRDKLTFKNSSKHVRLLLSFLRRKPVSGPEASKPSGHTEGIIGTHVSTPTHPISQ